MTREGDEVLDSQHDPSDGDEVEILEVVGVSADSDDEGRDAIDGPGNPVRSGDGVDGDSDADLLLEFDEDEPAEPLPGPPPGDGDPLAAPSDGADRIRGSDDEAFLRLRADYDNLRKRVSRERTEFERYATSELVGRLLPVLDNFERALATRPSEQSDRPLREGVAMIYAQLLDELMHAGLRTVPSVGERFDPNIHDAVSTEPGSNRPVNTVVAELQRGYLFLDRLLRPALVKVSTLDGELAGGGDGGAES